MTDTTEYVPPKVWVWNKGSGGRFANINRPIAGPTHDRELPVGKPSVTALLLGHAQWRQRSRSCSKSCWPRATAAPNTTPG